MLQDPEINELTLKWQSEEEILLCVSTTFTCLGLSLNEDSTVLRPSPAPVDSPGPGRKY